MAENVISTKDQVVTVRTQRGNLRIGPHGRIDGLWRIVSRELRTNDQVRAMCAGVGLRGRQGTKPIDRHTLLRWRAAGAFPEPVVTLGPKANRIELWSRTQVEAWLEERARARMAR